MPNRWTEFVKDYAKANDLTYGCALGTPACKEGYRKKYGVAKKVSQKKERESMGEEDMDAPAPKANISFKVSEKKGRKPKYATDEERKAAKRTQTLASNAKKRQEKSGQGITEVCSDCKCSDCKCSDMEGAGVFGDIVNTAKKATQAVAKVQGKIQTGVAKGVKKVVEKVGGDYANALLYGRNDYSPKVRALLEKFGGEVVRSASIVRNPVQQVLVEAMNVVSFGAFKKNMKDADYDQLFHLQLDFTLESGKEMRVEKVEVINMDESLTNKADGQIRPVSKMPTGMTLSSMMENTKNAMGGKFFLYSAKDNNCQDFLLAVLTANGMGDAEDYAFVKQNTAQLFKGLDTLRKVSNTLTDIGSKVNIATTGAGIGSSSSADVIHHHHHYHHSGDDFNKVMDSISSGKSGKGIVSAIGSMVQGHNNSGRGVAKKGRFVKGSPEAAAFMKALRDKRQSKK